MSALSPQPPTATTENECTVTATTRNNHAAVEQAGSGGHKEINRTNLTAADIDAGLQREVVKTQLELLRFHGRCNAFGFDSTLEVLPSAPHELTLRWSKDGATATLEADLKACTYRISEG